MRKLLGPLIFLIHTPLQILNLAFWASIIILCGLLKLVLPFPAIRTLLIAFFVTATGRLMHFYRRDVFDLNLFAHEGNLTDTGVCYLLPV